MEFKIEKKDNPHVSLYSKDELELAYKFSKKVYKELGTFLKAVVLFGSAARKRNLDKPVDDIDILLVIDDVSMKISAEMTEAYRIIVEKLIAETSSRLHITTLKFTHFWDYIRNGDPVGINILRDGVAIIDTGFFDPLQALLYNGRIRPTYESIWTYYTRAPKTLYNSRWHLLQATLDLYWAVVDSAHAALMKIGQIPPSPMHVADLMEQKMVPDKIVHKKYPETMRKFYTLSKKIIHRELNDINGKDYEAYYAEAKDFVEVMKKVIEK